MGRGLEGWRKDMLKKRRQRLKTGRQKEFARMGVFSVCFSLFLLDCKEVTGFSVSKKAFVHPYANFVETETLSGEPPAMKR